MFFSFLYSGVPMYALASAMLSEHRFVKALGLPSAKVSEPLGAPLTTEYMRQLFMSWPLDLVDQANLVTEALPYRCLVKYPVGKPDLRRDCPIGAERRRAGIELGGRVFFRTAAASQPHARA